MDETPNVDSITSLLVLVVVLLLNADNQPIQSSGGVQMWGSIRMFFTTITYNSYRMLLIAVHQ